ncbi:MULTISPECIES: hypothetical protein [unclassified Leptolyngbya]|uniref:hypothetical protein n=1 Tax=unclassified Leptolyngbya TaxID=2650499 RepID=UPI001681FE5E|nr:MULTISPECIES: hypothetical protein [unclassified Leptolyngbya]MBD1913661.1 hypothetical protein [Leptolyngbya sp. FACHB-8]MBD2157041.1 hypothetical protein [Leptolyngbya sp. FACHB-16]
MTSSWPTVLELTDAEPEFNGISQDQMSLAKWLIFAIVMAGSSLVAIAPTIRPSAAIYLPPTTAEEYDYYQQQIRQYSEAVAQPNHTIADHLRLADALANAGERESASRAYLATMTHSPKSHTH